MFNNNNSNNNNNNNNNNSNNNNNNNYINNKNNINNYYYSTTSIIASHGDSSCRRFAVTRTILRNLQAGTPRQYPLYTACTVSALAGHGSGVQKVHHVNTPS